jgi:nitrate/TMAO reductase-like tetraheme cytochrome c subunit
MSKKKIHGFIILSSLMTFTLLSLSFSRAQQMKQPLTEFSAPDIPEPQGFCGYCHILTYPAIFEKSHKTWKEEKHNQVSCVDCHYPPKVATGVKDAAQLGRPGPKKDHIPVGTPGHISYLKLGGETIKTIPTIINDSCTTASCHGKPDDPFKTKKLKFTEKVIFIHEPHFLEKNQIEGMQVNCTTCHQHVTDAKHFEVTQATCHLCHFANTKFNQGRASCELCHELPGKPIKAAEGSDTKDITHQMLKESGVTCSSCHFDLIQGSGETKVEPFFEGGVLKTILVQGAGRFKKESCLNCHDQVKYLKDANAKKLMHETHVTSKNARCFDCHQPIRHAKGDLNKPTPADCSACHQTPHRYQRLLAAGEERDGIPSIPDPMFKARTNCLGCHVEQELNHKGQTVMKASSQACVRCHTKDYEQMFGLWKREVSGELERALRLEKEATEAFDKHKPQLEQEKLDTVRSLFRTGRENLDIVRFGNGIHNAKYSIELLDAAMTDFKDMIAYLEGKDISEGEVMGE